MNLIDSNGLPNGFHLARSGFERVGAAEGRCLVARFISGRKVVDHLEPVLCAPDCAHAIKDVIHRCGAERARSGEFFVRVGDRKAFLVILDHLGPCIARRDPVAKPRTIHRESVALAFPLDHPLCEHQAHTAALAKASHDRAGGPVIAHPRHGANKRVAIGGKGKRSVDHGFDAHLGQRRKAAIGKGDGVLDLVEIIGQQLVPETPRRSVDRPRLAGLLIKPDAKPAPFLAQIAFACRVHDMRVFSSAVDDLCDHRYFVGHDILVLHRV